MDDQNKEKSNLGNDKNLHQTTDQPKEGTRPQNSISDAERENQRRRERDEKDRDEKDKGAIQEPPKTKTATP
jgi:hypothetical protein